MVKHKERIITELYNGNLKINELEVSSEADKGVSRNTKSEYIDVKVDSGTCNLCSAPCSSCLHINQTHMESKIGESLDETLKESVFSYSIYDSVPTEKSRSCEILQLTASETSNLIGVNSNFDSVSENAESKASVKIYDVSGTSEDVEVSHTLSGGSVIEKPHTFKPHERDADKSNSINKLEDIRGLEGHDDNVSCINEASKFSSSNAGTLDTKNLKTCATSPSSLGSEEYIKPIQSLTASCLDKNELEGSRKKSSGEVVSGTISGQQSASYRSGDIQDKKHGLLGNSEPPSVDCPKVEAESQSITDDLPWEDLTSIERRKEVEKVGELLSLPDARETSMQSEPVNESDESDDVVEHDVKVCDICGDAGREDLLAVCCRCNEGAEHTYCMQEMLDKIPEGDWLCEDCKSEERKAPEKRKHNLVHGDGPFPNHQISGHVDSKNGDLSGELDADVEDVTAQKHSSNVKLFRKRNADDDEISSVSKRQGLEPTTLSPKISSPKRVGMLSRDSSLKNLDTGRFKPAHHFPTGNSAPEVAAPTLDERLTSRGTFLKSKSFGAASAKPKIKLVDEVVPQKQRSKEAASVDTKGRLSRIMGKSMSFRSVNSGHMSSTDSKAKTLSPKFSHARDIKRQKHTKERSLVERKNSFRSERPLVNSAVTSSAISSPRVDRNLAVRGQTVSSSTTSNNRELKAVQSDSKVTQLARPVNKVVCKEGSELSIPLGEGKRQLSFSASGSSNFVEKSTQARMNNDCLSTSLSTGRPICKVDESVPDGLAQSQESPNLVENVKESSNSQPKQSITTGEEITPCPKCKDIGHSAEFCTTDSPEQSVTPSVLNTSSSKESMHKGNSLKAAIEAAMLKKPRIYRKNRIPDQSDELTVSGINSEVSSQDQLSNTSSTRKLVSGEAVNEQLASARNSNAESAKRRIGTNLKQFTNSAETVTTWSDMPIPNADGKYIMMDLTSDTPATSDLSILSAVPEYDYIWQGCFEVRRSGKQPDHYDGFQAHLSACASPRVLQTVNKFTSTVLLDEVPRASTWPIQFEETRVNEDHIALYFFARDCASYEKSYKIILESMMRNDLALKGNIDDVEILIFPSNQLPVKYQRWNLMFFFWGIFRGKRVGCLQQGPGSPKKISSSRDRPAANLSSPEDICSPVPMDKDVPPPCNKACKVVSDVETLVDLQCLPSTKTMSLDTNTKAVYLFRQPVNSVISTEEQPEYSWDCNSVPTNQMKSPQSWEDIRSRTLLEGQVDSDCKVTKEQLASIEVANTASGSNINDEMKPGHSNIPADRHPLSQNYSEFSSGVQSLTSVSSVNEVNNEDKLKRRNVNIGLLEAETAPDKRATRSGPMELNSWPLTGRKQSIFDLTLPKSEAAYTGSIQDVLWNDTKSMSDNVEHASKKQKLDYSDLYVSIDHTNSSRDGSMIQDSTPSFLEKHIYGEGSDEASMSRTSENSERYFFPVDPYHEKHVELSDNSIRRKRALSDNGEPVQERVPNLELALGAEIKPPLKQSLPHFLAAEVDKTNWHQSPARTVATANESLSAALSLSLSFPFSDNEQDGQPVATKEHLRSRTQTEVDFTSLFGGFSDK